MQLGQLAADHGLAVAERRLGRRRGTPRSRAPPRRRRSPAARPRAPQARRARRWPRRQEPLEREPLRRQPRHRHERRHRRRPRDRHDADARRDRAAHEVVARVGDRRASRRRTPAPRSRPPRAARRAPARARARPRRSSSSAAVAMPWCASSVARPPRVLRGDQVDLAQHAQRAQRDVLEVPDRRRDDVEDAAAHAAAPDGSAAKTSPGGLDAVEEPVEADHEAVRREREHADGAEVADSAEARSAGRRPPAGRGTSPARCARSSRARRRCSATPTSASDVELLPATTAANR